MKKIIFEEAIKYLNEGKKIKDEFDNLYWREDQGLFRKDGSNGEIFYNTFLRDSNDYYLPEEPKPFEITKTGLYKTRDGRQAFVSTVTNFNIPEFPIRGLVFGDSLVANWTNKGQNLVYGESDIDIVSEWGTEDA